MNTKHTVQKCYLCIEEFKPSMLSHISQKHHDEEEGCSTPKAKAGKEKLDWELDELLLEGYL